MNAKQSVLITDDVHPILIEKLEQRNYTVDYYPEISYQNAIDCISDYQGLVVNSKILCKSELLTRATQLKWIARLGSGMEIIDQKLAKQLGIYAFNTPEGNSNAVAEHALGLLLSLLRNIPRSDHQMRRNDWQREYNRGEELSDKTVGIIGYGHTGSKFGELLMGMNIKLLVFDKYKQLSLDPKRSKVVNDIQEIQKGSDIISLHLPLTEETFHMVNESFFQGCTRPIYLINTSRGPIVNTSHLLRALDQHQIKGAALDVFENEKPLSFSTLEKQMYADLAARQNVVLTPHIAGWTHQSKKSIADWLIQKLDLFISNK
ncbi:MAG TPA: NAD(P)-dependent oxidoreductase [Saprospiraceae bacterium]|nr:NAD(P)-dependent oxidoreductase [Saprospiraceae bacterium]